jgi:hypothetical protein
MAKSHIELAHQFQEKFEFYLLSLVFTLLAVSIQTAKIGTDVIPVCFEVIGWMCLLVSGVFGLWRMEYIPVTHGKIGKKREIEDQIIHLETLRNQGQRDVEVLINGNVEVIEKTLENNRGGIEILDDLIASLEKHNLIKYRVHKYAFVIGVSAILAARSWMPIKSIIS